MEKRLERLKLIGDRVVVLLDEAVSHTVTEKGITVPMSTVYETDGGRLATKTSAQKHVSMGTVVLISDYALAKIRESIPDFNVGDKVFLPEAVHSKHYYFYPDRSSMVLNFDGHVVIPHSLIEAKYV